MSEQLLNIMRQWLEQLEQHDSADAQPDWDTLQELLSAGLSRPIPQEHTELLLKLTRQSASLNRFATELLEQGQVDRDRLLERFKQHLDELTRDWVLHSWELPEQLGTLMSLFNLQQQSWQDSLKQLTELLTAFLGRLQPNTRPELVTQLKESIALLERFEQAQTRYLAQLSAINADALEHMSQQLDTSAITDLEHLHQLWIDCYERVYQQRIDSSEYAMALGEISNAAMSLRLGWQRQRDHLCSVLSLVSDTRHDELAQRHHQLRRRVRSLERELAALRQSLQPKATDKDPNAQDQS